MSTFTKELIVLLCLLLIFLPIVYYGFTKKEKDIKEKENEKEETG